MGKCTIHHTGICEGGVALNPEIMRAALYGLIIGDALGVPYEFYKNTELPPKEQIEFEPPLGFLKAYPNIPAGTWSDDGAQALCLLESLCECGKFVLEDFAKKLVLWLKEGTWAVNGLVFDVGMQTQNALTAYENGVSAFESGNIEPEGKGNGALMRVLPLAIWHSGSDRQLVLDAHTQCLITHGHICNQVCCALYVLVARELCGGTQFINAYQNALSKLRKIYENMPAHSYELETELHPDQAPIGSGTGYVVDTLKSAFMILRKAISYEDAVKQAVLLGNDTDTTACVTGGLAGIIFGFDNIPQKWYTKTEGKQLIEKLLRKVELKWIK